MQAQHKLDEMKKTTCSQTITPTNKKKTTKEQK
jgi:hypothetical protein